MINVRRRLFRSSGGSTRDQMSTCRVQLYTHPTLPIDQEVLRLALSDPTTPVNGPRVASLRPLASHLCLTSDPTRVRNPSLASSPVCISPPPPPPFIPFTCADLAPVLIECDKSFTRSDALAKHMHLQHNVEGGVTAPGGNPQAESQP
jgi:hypothetical protein